MSNYQSTIPAAITALLGSVFTPVAAANSPFGPGGLTIAVVDGEPVEYVDPYFLAVTGFSNWEQEWFTVGGVGVGNDRLERYDLDCLIHCWQGDTNPSARRGEAFTLMEAVRAQLYSVGLNLGVLPMAADVALLTGSAVQGPANGTSGWGIDLSFTLHVENALLTP